MIQKCTQLGKGLQFFLIKVNRWSDNDDNTSGLEFKPELDDTSMRIGKKADLFDEDCTIYYPIATVTMDQDFFTKKFKYTFHCRRGMNNDWYQIDGKNQPKNRGAPNEGIIYLFMADFVNDSNLNY